MSSDISGFVRRGTKTADREDINKLLGMITPIAFAEPEDEGVQERIILSNAIRERSTTVTSGGADASTSDTRNRYAVETPTLQMPTACDSYPYSHTTNGTFTWEKTTNTKYGGGGIFGGTNEYISIANIVGSDLDIANTDALTIAYFFKVADPADLDGIVCKREGLNLGEVGVCSYIDTAGQINFEYSDGVAEATIRTSAGLDDGTWHSTVMTKSTTANESGMNIYADGSLDNNSKGSTAIGAGITNTQPFTIGAMGDSSRKLTGSLAWVMVLKEEVDSTWASNFDNGFFDWSGGNLITCIPFVGDESVWAEATTPFCVSS